MPALWMGQTVLGRERAVPAAIQSRWVTSPTGLPLQVSPGPMKVGYLPRGSCSAVSLSIRSQRRKPRPSERDGCQGDLVDSLTPLPMEIFTPRAEHGPRADTRRRPARRQRSPPTSTRIASNWWSWVSSTSKRAGRAAVVRRPAHRRRLRRVSVDLGAGGDPATRGRRPRRHCTARRRRHHRLSRREDGGRRTHPPATTRCSSGSAVSATSACNVSTP